MRIMFVRAVRPAALVLFVLGLATLWPLHVQAQEVDPAAGAAVDAVVRLAPLRDASVAESAPTTNFGTETDLAVVETPGSIAPPFSTYALLQFDLSPFPQGTIVNTATLTLRQLEASGGGDWPIAVNRLTDPWDETSVNWETRPDAVTAAPPLIAPEEAPLDISADLTALTAAMINTPASTPNNGLELAGIPQGTALSRVFASRESATPPRLTIDYTLPPIRVCLETIDGCVPAPNALVHNRTTGGVRVADANGWIGDMTGFALGHELWARYPVSRTNGATLYWTSPLPVEIVASAYVDTGDGHELWMAVTSSAPLLVQDLDLTAQWNVQGIPADATLLRNRLVSASNALYAFTDGQFALGRITVRQSYEGWEEANIHLFANNTLQPKAIVGGIVLTDTLDVSPTIALSYTPGAISMGSYWNRFGTPPGSLNLFEGVTYTEAQMEDDWALALAHEFGHYLLYLFDTYTGIDGVADLDLTRLCTGTAMGDVYVPTNQGFLWDTAAWKARCGGTEAYALHNGRVEWATIRAFYPWVQIPSAFVPGPPAPPVPVTAVVFVPSSSAGAAAAQLFTLNYVGGELSSGEARAFLLRGGRVLEQGKPAKGSTQLALTGAEIGDRLCVYDINDHAEDDELPRHQFGCEQIAPADEILQMTRNVAWSPEVLLIQTGPQSLQIQVTQSIEGPAAPMQVQLFPEHQTGLAALTIPLDGAVYSATVTLTQTVPPLYVQLYVDETPALPQSRREVIVDRGTGGGGAYGPARAYDGVLIYSSDGNAAFEPDETIDLDAGESIAWQSMPGTPPLPFYKWISGQSYRLDAYPAALVEDGTIRIRFVDELGVAAQGVAPAALTAGANAIYFWDGMTWTELETTVTVPAGSTEEILLASARSRGVGVYAVLGDAPPDRLRFLPMVMQD